MTIEQVYLIVQCPKCLKVLVINPSKRKFNNLVLVCRCCGRSTNFYNKQNGGLRVKVLEVLKDCNKVSERTRHWMNAYG